MHLFVYMSRHPKCTKKLPIPQRCQNHENTCLHQFVAFNHGSNISCHIAEFWTLDFLNICVNTALLEADKHSLTHWLCHRLQFKQGAPQKMGLTHKERETWWLQIHAFNIFLLYIPFTRAMHMIHVPTFNIIYIESKCQFTIKSLYWNNPGGA